MVRQYQTHLVEALTARIVATEAAVGPRFAFEIRHRSTTTLVAAHQWPNIPQHIPFDRIYNYVPPEAEGTDVLLEYCVTAQIDAIVEVELAPPLHAKHLLHQYHFWPQWAIAWLHLDLAQVTPFPYSQVGIRKVAPDEMDMFARLFVEGYGYHGASATAWQTFARYGYTAQGFHCFVAEVDHTPAGFGVLHVQGTTALVDGAATLPQFQGLGVHKALLTARIEHARKHGCTHAFSRTGAGSISQQNMEKVGFHEVYRTTAWRRSIEC